MVFACQLTPAEMREAFRMNLTASFWTRALLSNFRALALLGVVLFAVFRGVMNGEAVSWEATAGFLAFAVLLFCLYLWRMSRTLGKTAAQVNLACASMTVDGAGITSTGLNGATNFLPWAELQRFKEGRLVYTVGPAKAYKVIPKRVLTPMQQGELQGLLQMHVRPTG